MLIWTDTSIMSPSKELPENSPDASTSKVSIKGFSLASKAGAKPISFATKNKPLTTTLGKRPRTALHHGSDDEDDEGPVRHEAVTGFDIQAGGALRKEAKEVKQLLVIPGTKTRDWREEIRKARARKNLLPPEVQAQRAGKGRTIEDATNVVNGDGSEPQWGLTVTKRVQVENDSNNAEAHVSKSTETIQSEAIITEAIAPLREKTDDELALEALIGAQKKKKGPDMIIPIAGTGEDDMYVPPPQLTEGDAYRRAIEAAPDVSTLDDYERVPVEEFGAALLRGMGWKEGDAKKGRVERPKEAQRRQNLLGLGAKELKGAEELGAWVQKSDPKRLTTGGGRGDRRPKANEFREREERKRESRDERHGSHRRDRERDRDDYRERDRDRRR
jgi:hypothetical protein